MRSLLFYSLSAHRHGRAVATGLTEVDHRHPQLLAGRTLDKPVGGGDAIESARRVHLFFCRRGFQRIEAGTDKTSGANEVFHLTLAAARRAQIRKRAGHFAPLLARHGDGGKIHDLAPLALLPENRSPRLLPDETAKRIIGS